MQLTVFSHCCDNSVWSQTPLIFLIMLAPYTVTWLQWPHLSHSRHARLILVRSDKEMLAYTNVLTLFIEQPILKLHTERIRRFLPSTSPESLIHYITRHSQGFKQKVPFRTPGWYSLQWTLRWTDWWRVFWLSCSRMTSELMIWAMTLVLIVWMTRWWMTMMQVVTMTTMTWTVMTTAMATMR